MSNFKFELGQLVRLNPTGEKDAFGLMKGQVVGRAEFIDGAIQYTVSAWDNVDRLIRRHTCAEVELTSAADG